MVIYDNFKWSRIVFSRRTAPNSLAIMSIASEISRGLNLEKILKDMADAKTKNKFLLGNAFLDRRQQ